jgi:hypothetical protein
VGKATVVLSPGYFLNVISEHRLPLEAGTALTKSFVRISKRISQPKLPLAPLIQLRLPMAYAPFHLEQFEPGKSRSPRQLESATALLIQKIKG